MPSTHTLFGLNVHSNLSIPGLSSETQSNGLADVEVHLGVSPSLQDNSQPETEELTYTSAYSDDAGNPGLKIWESRNGKLLRLEYYDGIQFWLERNGKSLWATWPPEFLLEDAAAYLLGPVFGLLLRLRGVTCLHASAVSIDDGCVLFVGAEGAGKSTTAAAFARRGYAVLSDDVAALVETPKGFQVVPAYPHVYLWQDSVEMLYGSSEALPRFSSGWEKCRLALGNGGSRFETRTLPLRAIYLLGERRATEAPKVEAVGSQAGLLSLVADTFANKILDRQMRAKEFAVLGRLITTVPVRLLHPHSGPPNLDSLCTAVLDNLASLEMTESARA